MVKNVQIDTNGTCGSKCWYCPVRYIERPSNMVMPEEGFRLILDSLVGVTPKPTIWLAAYNDILMDPLLNSRLTDLGHYGYTVPILSNGIGLLNNVDILHNKKNVIGSFTIDLPAGYENDYSKYTGNSGKVFNRIIEGIRVLYNKDPEYYWDRINIHVNGVYDDTYARNQLKVDIPIGDTARQVARLKEILPELAHSVKDCRPLCDRAGSLREFAIDNSVMPCRGNWKLPIGATKASGCNGGDRLNSWIHISSKGDLFLCCQDYKQETTYGNMYMDCLFNSFYSEAREAAVALALETICVKCQFSY